MKVLVVAPWFRTLAHLYGRTFEQLGHQVLVVTTTRHFEPGYDFCDEITLSLATGSRSLLTQVKDLRREVARFDPDVAVTEPFHHPAWLALLPPRRPQLLMLHEPDTQRDRPDLDRKRKLVAAAQRRRVTSVVSFSEYAAGLARRQWSEVGVVPLVSEMPDEWVPPGVEAQRRRGVAVAGRLTHNKGLDIAVAAWQRLPDDVRAAEPLTLLVSEGDGYSPEDIAGWRREGVDVRRGRYSFRTGAEVLASTRVMLLPYRNATQSGAQLWAMQVGCIPLVSDVGSLSEYQPSLAPPVPDLNVASWTGRLQEELARDDAARHAQTRRRYLELAGPTPVSSAWESVLGQLPGPR